MFVSYLSYVANRIQEVDYTSARYRPRSDNCHQSSTPTDWQMFHDVNATEDWDGNYFSSCTSCLTSIHK